MNDNIAGAYKRKEYGWFAFYIFTLVVGVRLWGIAGAVGGSLMCYGLYKTIKDSTISTTKKTLLSLAYIIGGIVTTLVIITILKFALLTFFGIDSASTSAANQVLNSTNATTTIQLKSSGNTSRLEKDPYMNAKSNFQIRPPKAFVVSQDGDIVGFGDPDQTSGAEIDVMVNPDIGNKYTLQEYAAGGIQGFVRDNPAIKNIQILSQGSSTLLGEPAYVIEYTHEYQTENFGTYTVHVRAIYMIHDGVGYNIHMTNVWDQWDKSVDLLMESALSFKFLK